MAVSEIQEVGKRSVVVRVNESVNAANAKLFTEELLAVVAAYPQFDIVLNFKNVAYISSAGLRALLLGQKTATSKGGTMKVINVQPAVMQVFNLSGFAKVLTLG